MALSDCASQIFLKMVIQLVGLVNLGLHLVYFQDLLVVDIEHRIQHQIFQDYLAHDRAYCVAQFLFLIAIILSYPP